MKSICIKTNNEKEIDYLLKNLENYKLDNIYYSFKEFKIYKNIIVHYTGTNEKLFLENISNTLSCLVLDLYEQIIIRNLTKSEYFYFEKQEQIQIEEITEDDLYDKEESIPLFTGFSDKNQILMIDKISPIKMINQPFIKAFSFKASNTRCIGYNATSMYKTPITYASFVLNSLSSNLSLTFTSL